MRQAELFRQAKRRVEQRRQLALAEAAQAKEEVYRAVPQLEQLDMAHNSAGARAATLSADGQPQEAAKAMAQAEQAAGDKKALLADIGLTPADLEPNFHCRFCSDTGIRRTAQGTETCRCVLEQLKLLRRDSIHEGGGLTPKSFASFSLDYYPVKMEGSALSPRQTMTQILQDCQNYAADFSHNSQSLYMYGDAGLGKTHLALAIASEVLEKGHDVIYVSSQQAFATIADEYFNQSGRNKTSLFTSMLEADLLVLDDLGTEFLNAFVLSKLYELIQSRLQKPTIYTTNIHNQETLEQRYTEKISSRLLGECFPMPFVGYDVRLQKYRT